MSGVPCARYAELRSSFVDGALGDGRREKLLTHLVGCAACRDDVSELRAVRNLLRAGRDRPLRPADLQHRLRQIGHPSPSWVRRGRRVRALRRSGAAALAAGALATAAGLVGYLAAPTEALAAVPDPSGQARTAFADTLGDLPFSGDAWGAVMLVQPAELHELPAGSDPGTPASAVGPGLSPVAARAVLTRVKGALDTVSYSGTQFFSTRSDGRVLAADLQVDTRAGQGSEVTVMGPGGQRLLSSFRAAAATSARMGDDRLATLLQRSYRVTATAGAQVAGRPATVLTASRGGVAAGRWWVDDETGLITWQESYDGQGAVRTSSGFRTLRLHPGAGILQHLPPTIVPASTTTTLALSNAMPLAGSGWACQSALVGLPLIRIRTDAATDPGAVHLVYSDGLSTVSVFERRGVLAGPPAGAQLDPALDAYLDQGVSTLATWQSGDTVFTLMTDASAALASEAVRTLPHQGPARPTTLERVQAGWAALLAAMRG